MKQKSNLLKNKYSIALYVQFAIAAVVAVYVLLNPVAFLKSNTIKPAYMDKIMTLQNPTSVDIAGLVSKIPYKSGLIYTVEPKKRFEEILATGQGNCSNKTYALAYYLQQKGINYNVVHLLIPDEFLDGEGHVTMQTTFNLDSITVEGIVDMYEGGLPEYNQRFITVQDMMNAGFSEEQFRIFPLNPGVNQRSRYYLGFMDKAVIGLTPSVEVNRHFDWVQSIYIPLGVKKLEKFFYDGLALLIGRHPAIYVSHSDYERLYSHSASRKYMNISALWLIRILILAIPFTMLVMLLRLKMVS